MARLLIVHHTTSPATAELLDAAATGAAHPELADVEVVRRAALAAGAVDLLAADALLLGTPANIGYMSGALKHFLDLVYYPCGDECRGLPYGLYVHGNSHTAGAVRAVETAGREAEARIEILGTTIEARFGPNEIKTFVGGRETDLLEW